MKLITIFLLIGIISAEITLDDTVSVSENWTDVLVTGNGSYIVNYDTMNNQFDLIQTSDSTTTSQSKYTSNDSIKGLGTLNGSDKVFHLLSENGAARTVEILNVPGFAQDTNYDLSNGGESDIPENPLHAAPNSDNTKLYFASSYQLATVNLAGNSASVVDVLADANCSLTENNIYNGWLQPELDRFIVEGDMTICVLVISTGTVTEYTITHSSDISNKAPFGSDYLALEDRTNKKLIIKNFSDDSVLFQYQWGSSQWIKYPVPSRDGDVLIAPFNNDGNLMIINTDEPCEYLVGSFEASDNKISGTIDSETIAIYGDDQVLLISVDYTTWDTFEGCSPGDSSASYGTSGDGGDGSGDDTSTFGSYLQASMLSLFIILALL